MNQGTTYSAGLEDRARIGRERRVIVTGEAIGSWKRWADWSSADDPRPAISAAAALGGFLFGFDTAVINGNGHAIRGGFGPERGGDRCCGVVCAARFSPWRLVRRAAADQFGRVPTMRVAAALLASALEFGPGVRHVGPDLLAWSAASAGVASVIAPTYMQIAGSRARPTRLAAAAGDRARHLAALLATRGWRSAAGGTSQMWLGLEAWRWMFLVAVVPGAGLRRAGVRRARIAAPPGRQAGWMTPACCGRYWTCATAR
jgi:hypothetical protein